MSNAKKCLSLYSAAVLAASGFAQQIGGVTTLDLTPGAKSLEIHLAGSEPCHSIIGVRIGEHLASNVQLQEVARTRRDIRGIPIGSVAGWRAVPVGRYSLEAGRLAVSCSDTAARTISLFVTSPTPLVVKYFKNGLLGTVLSVQDHVVLRDGVASVARPENLAHLALLSVDSFAPAHPTAIGTARLLDATVNTAEMRSHLDRYAQPKLERPFSRSPGVLRLEIDSEGFVTDVSGPSVASLSQDAMAAVRSWKFRPFPGRQKVVAAVAYQVDAHGILQTTLDPSVVIVQ
ncbi:MAG TPA: hypothetical protein DEH78_08785 [Solibacterales bacterium]|nr:hypothetical protein [Bryobacterales bacterium]